MCMEAINGCSMCTLYLRSNSDLWLTLFALARFPERLLVLEVL